MGVASVLLLARRAAARSDRDQRRLENRLELWASFAQKTENLIVRTALERRSALLKEPHVAIGTLYAQRPARLLFHDDAAQGSSTFIEPQHIAIQAHQSGATPIAIDSEQHIGAAWLQQRLTALFLGPSSDELTANCQIEIPNGGYRIELLPPRGSLIRQSIRSIGLRLDPVTGAVIRLSIAETQGDELDLKFTDHRQNVDLEDFEAAAQQTGVVP